MCYGPIAAAYFGSRLPVNFARSLEIEERERERSKSGPTNTGPKSGDVRIAVSS
jgi:hypothetical protein